MSTQKEKEILSPLPSPQLNRVKAVEKEKSGLEGAKKEAEEYLAMKTQASRKQHSLYQRYMSVSLPSPPLSLSLPPLSLSPFPLSLSSPSLSLSLPPLSLTPLSLPSLSLSLSLSLCR